MLKVKVAAYLLILEHAARFGCHILVLLFYNTVDV